MLNSLSLLIILCNIFKKFAADVISIQLPDQPGWRSYGTAMHGRRQLNTYMAYASYLDITSATNFLKLLT